MHDKLLKISFLFFLLAFILVSCGQHEVQKIEFSGDWKFKNDTAILWLPAKVPGCSHLDLLHNNLIPDPFFADNESMLQWIGESDWIYTKKFDASEIINNDRVELVFEGLDTYADVYLNDSLLLSADNMFRKWVVPVKNLLKGYDNNLTLIFHSPEKIEEEKAKQVPYQLPDNRGFTRKAPYQYGWDWGPKFITAGIWQPVYLQGWSGIRILDVHVHAEDVLESEVTLIIEAEIETLIGGMSQIECAFGRNIFFEEIDFHKGINLYKTEIIVSNPDLWWPNGMGDQPIYDLSLAVKSKNSIDSKNVKFGIRQIELIREKDSIGESFYFKINGVPFFAKGANYIPQDNFPSRVTDEKYHQTIQNAIDANMNMLRVWGGGIYEKDLFYELCDQNGLLVWQDFMFACNMYPGDSMFLENVKQEALYQVKRLRNHPSMALWCGNNEVSEGWFNWGWQKALNYTVKDSIEIWNNYLKIFEDVLPQTVTNNSPYLPYTSSSPTIGWGHEEALYEGDMHYWGVWWGEEPFEVYEQKVGRFMSEFGFQGFPDVKTLDSCLKPKDKNLQSKVLLNHQKNPRGMQLIQTYMERDFPVPTNFEKYVYVSQLVQAHGVGMAIEAQRRSMPHCMGALYWQLNDCWPVISWSSVDYYNRWKALHFRIRDLYQDVLISFEENENELAVFIISDRQNNFHSELNLKIIDFDGNLLWQESQGMIVEKATSGIYQQVDISKVEKQNQVLVAELVADNATIAKSNYFFVSPKLLNLTAVDIKYEISQTMEGFEIGLSCDKLAKNVFLFTPTDDHFSNNYFDLLPGTSETISLESKASIDEIEFEITTLNDLPHK